MEEHLKNSNTPDMTENYNSAYMDPKLEVWMGLGEYSQEIDELFGIAFFLNNQRTQFNG